jgi:signal peptidase I
MDNGKNLLKKIGLFLGDLIETVVVALAIFVLVYFFLVQPHQVTGNSMLPNFEHGEYLLTEKVTYRFSPPKRGDVIVFKAPHDQQKDFIKRVVGLPREKIKITQGEVYVNDEKISESYLDQGAVTLPKSFVRENEEILIPLDEYFVLGDNRQHSSDSREWGTVRKNLIIGKAWLVYWPLTKISFITAASN